MTYLLLCGFILIDVRFFWGGQVPFQVDFPAFEVTIVGIDRVLAMFLLPKLPLPLRSPDCLNGKNLLRPQYLSYDAG